jgi:hypothetical protein
MVERETLAVGRQERQSAKNAEGSGVVNDIYAANDSLC